MVLYMIGLGLDNEKDITLKGLEAVKRSKAVYLEDYTSRLNCSREDLEREFGNKIILADRKLVEQDSDVILDGAKEGDVSFLVIGDVFGATTHVDLYLRAKEKGIEVKIVNNASILNAVGIVGLELYKFGKTTTMPFFEKSFEPETPYDVILMNRKNGLHTLLLFDIKRDKGRYMDMKTAISQLLLIEKKRGEGLVDDNLKVVGCARIGSETPTIKYGKIADVMEHYFGDPLFCMIIPGKLHFMEEKMLSLWE